MFQNIRYVASEWFWNPNFWLPVNFTWADIQPTADHHYPDTRDIYTYPIVVAIILLVLKRRVIYPKLGFPLAKYFGLNCDKSLPPKSNKVLEDLYLKYSGHVPAALKQRVADKLKWKSKAVDLWIYQRKASTKLPIGEKFAETSFLALMHTIAFFYGLVAIHGQIWTQNIIHCWEGYPYHEIENIVWGYYIFMLGFFWSLTIGQLLQPSNSKDQLAIYAHHLFTILLLCFSWTLNFVRVGSIILVLHEAADWILLIAKLGHLVENETFTSIFFGLTILVWFVTRLIIFPFWVMHSALFVGTTYMFMPSAYLFFFLTFCLVLLNIMWLAMMLRIVFNKMISGKIEDVRSSEAESISADESGDENLTS